MPPVPEKWWESRRIRSHFNCWSSPCRIPRCPSGPNDQLGRRHSPTALVSGLDFGRVPKPSVQVKIWMMKFGWWFWEIPWRDKSKRNPSTMLSTVTDRNTRTLIYLFLTMLWKNVTRTKSIWWLTSKMIDLRYDNHGIRLSWYSIRTIHTWNMCVRVYWFTILSILSHQLILSHLDFINLPILLIHLI